MAIRIITDSTSDIPLEEQKTLGIEIASLSVIFGDKKYLDGVDLKKEQFYEMLSKSPVLPSTSQVNPEYFHKLFKKYTDAGDEVILIVISSKLSGTYQSAVIAKDMVGSDDIYLVDSKSATMGLAILVYEAIALRDKGICAKDIHRQLLRLTGRIKFLAIVNTLKYLKMGGRLSSSAALIGEILNIKPLVSVINGEVKAVGRVRGHKAAYLWVLNQIKESPPDEKYIKCLGHSNAPEMLKEFTNFLSSHLDIGRNHVCEIGGVIGTHAGPGCVGISYIQE